MKTPTGKSSETVSDSKQNTGPTCGDGMAMSADLIRLLAPVIKAADQRQFNALKKQSKFVQEIFRRLMSGSPLVDDAANPDQLAFLDCHFKPVRNAARFDPKFFVLKPDVRFSLDVLPAENTRLRVRVLAWQKNTDPEIACEYRSLDLLCEFETYQSQPIISDSCFASYASLLRCRYLEVDPIHVIQQKFMAKKGLLEFELLEDCVRVSIDLCPETSHYYSGEVDISFEEMSPFLVAPILMNSDLVPVQ